MWRRWTGNHIAEIPQLVKEFGQLSYKIYMFYGGHGLHGSAR